MLNHPSKASYLNPYTSFGFNKLFGIERNKELLIVFLNALFNKSEVITDLAYLNRTYKEVRDLNRRALFDVCCENEKGEKILIEIQRGEQPFFRGGLEEATPFFREQAECGDWDYRLKAVYVIGILNFTFDDDDDTYFHHEVCLTDKHTGKVFYNKLTFIYLEMPKFNKTEDELDGMFDKWLFVLRNLSRLLERPRSLQERVFTQLFESAEIAKFTKVEYEAYEESLKVYRDWQNVIRTAEFKARAEGLEEGRKAALLSMASKMRAKGMDIATICELTGLSPEDFE